MKNLLRSLFHNAGYKINKIRPDNRFSAMSDGLRLLQRRFYDPKIVIDVGAYIGEWTMLTKKFFPRANYHLIEPQPECIRRLKYMTEVTIYPVAVTSPGINKLFFFCDEKNRLYVE